MTKPTRFQGIRLRPALAGIADVAADSTTPDYGNIQNLPTEFPPEAHTHPVSEIEDLPVAVAGARDDPEGALKNLLTALDTAGIITDNTTAT